MGNTVFHVGQSDGGRTGGVSTRVHEDDFRRDVPLFPLGDDCMLVKANSLPQEAPDPIPADGPTHGSCDPESNRNTPSGLPLRDDETANRPAGKNLPVCKDSGKRPVTMKGLPGRSVGRQWTLIGSAPRLVLAADGELVSSLGTTAIDDLTAVLGRHARAESVRVASLSLVRLECSLHCAFGP